MRVLLVAHGFPPAQAGGTEVYAHDLGQALSRGGHEVAVLARGADPGSDEYAVTREAVGRVAVVRVNNTFRHAASFEDTYRNAAIRALAAAFVDEFRPDVVHVHHLTCLDTGIVSECARRGVPVVLTLHDYWLLCHRGQLLDVDLAPCDGPSADRCSRCAGFAASPRREIHALARAARAIERRLPPRLAAIERRLATNVAHRVVPPGASGATARRLDEARSVWNEAAVLLAPSRAVLDRFAVHGAPIAKLRQQELGIDLRPFVALAREPSDRLRLGFAGSLMVSKAPHLFLEAAAGLPRDRVTVTVAGGLAPYHGDDSYPRKVRPLLEQPWVRWLGRVSREEMPTVLAGLDVLVLPSIWPENSPLLVREARAAGAVVVASRLAGLPEMIADGRDGLLFEPGNANDLRRVLSRLLDEPGLLQRLREAAPPVRTIDDDAAWTSAVYEEVREATRPARPVPVGGVIVNYRSADDTLLAVRSIEASRRSVSPLVVVDNEGDGSCARALAAGHAGATVTVARANLGFSGGSNAGIREALAGGARLVLLLNSDAVVAPDTLERLEAALAADPGAGIAAPLIVSRAEPSQVASAGIAFSEVSGRMRQEGVGRSAAELAAGPPLRVGAVSGCAMLVRREVFEQAGFFDERYFFSFEDIEFCRRAARAGWASLLVPGALVLHEGHRSIGRGSAVRLYFAARNHLLLARSVAPLPRPASWLRGAAILALNLAHAARTPDVGLGPALLAVIRGTLDHVRGRYGKAPVPLYFGA